MRLRGRTWKFGDDINTDLIQPMAAILRPLEEQPRWAFRASRPGWAHQVKPGDILIAGRNFGTGSGRPAARVLKDLGIACLLAESINGLFFRNCVNYALPVLEVPEVAGAFAEGDEAEVDFEAATVRNLGTGAALSGRPWPPALLQILQAGGVLALLEQEGLLAPFPRTASGH